MNYLTPLEIFYKWEKQKQNDIFLSQPINDKLYNWTWGEVGQQVRKMAAYIKSFNLTENSKIGILSNWKTILQEIIRLIFSINIIKRLYYIFRWILFQKGISFQSKMFLEREMEKKTKRFLRKLPFFTTLPAEDKEIIMEKNVPLGVLFQKCTFFNPSK